MIPENIIQDWIKNKKRIQDRVLRIKKRLKKYNKQLIHYEMRVRSIQKYEKENSQEIANKEKNS